MNRPLLIILAILLAVSAATGCRRHNPVPLPEGYPRIDVPAADYRPADSLPLTLMVNTAVRPMVRAAGEAVWVDLIYPSFEPSAIYLTLSPATPDSLDIIMTGLADRMRRNSGGEKGELTTLTSEGGWDCRMVVTPSSAVCPVQILAVAPDSSATLFGTLFLNRPFAQTNDSIRPVIDTAERDLLRLLQCLK